MSKKVLPKIIYGTAWKKEATKDLVITAVLQGFTAIDTACQPKHYREDLVGEALQVLYDQHGIKRDDLWLQTKFTSIAGQDTSKPLPYDPSLSIPDQIKASFQTSLKNLRTTYLDSYILHSPLPTLHDTLTAWHTLGSLQDSGSVGMIGVSNAYDVDVIEAMAAERKVEVVQNRWYERNGWDRDVVRYCRDNGVMYQSFWTLTGSPSLLKHPTVLDMAQSLECTPAQIVFRIAQENGITPLAGSKNAERMKHGVITKDISLEQYTSDPDFEALQKALFN
ncbi:Aldo/keto reductase [Fomitiporia mediterranea MF3/22]|uniref:Aldo/keto reductase n=1 Tax=Fomitiporia mediterranea (strain MF3/22) TaxID=694068 RepID=UPI00044090DD|nr:Aldo/keto reductase [Fomitiporia mediterranea MF3/22]EJD03217.1 Aldo/keto reductase [Fomitiporia mediterranea MF3/22]